MTEKSYGGNDGRARGKVVVSKTDNFNFINEDKKEEIENDFSKEDIEDYIKAGKIAREAREFARNMIKRGMLLVEIADKIDKKIEELGGKPAFPVNLSLNDIAAHYVPSWNDETKAEGLLKVDIGVHINGAIADTAFSLNLSDNKEYDKLIEAADNAVKNALKLINEDKRLSSIGREIHKTIVGYGYSPIRNLCGHELGKYMIHAGITIPNYDNNNSAVLEEGAYAVEPFATTGSGIVYDGKESEIYRFEERKGVRIGRDVMDFIEEEYKTLPFCSRWLVKKFGSRALLALKFLEQAGVIYRYPQLVEKSHAPVAQAEHSFLVYDNRVEVTTE